MSDTSSSILFVPVPKAAPAARLPTTPSHSAADTESITYVYHAAAPHVIQPSQQPISARGSRFDIQNKPTTLFRPTMVRTQRENIRALEALYQRGLKKEREHDEWVRIEQEKNDKRREAVEGCTFSPVISSFAKSLRRPRAMSPENRFRQEVDLKLQTLASQRAQSETRELKECTFRPLTLSAARVEPSSYVRRSDRHQLLYNDAETRAKTRAKIATLMEEQAVGRATSAKRELVPDEEADLVTRLSKPVLLSERPTVRFEPEINAESERIIAARRSRDPSPQSVIERLFKPMEANRQEDLTEEHPYRPSINKKSHHMVAQKQTAYLSDLFYTLAGGKTIGRVLDIARSAVSLLSLTMADELVTILRDVPAETLTEREFIDHCTSRRFNQFSVVHPPSKDKDAIAARKAANINNNNKFEVPTFVPKIDPNSIKLAEKRNLRPPKVSLEHQSNANEEKYTFTPSINPLPTYLADRVALLREKKAKQQSELSREEDLSPTQHASRTERLRELNQRATKVSSSLVNERLASDALIAELQEAMAEARSRHHYLLADGSPSTSPDSIPPTAASESQVDDNILLLLRRRRLMEDNQNP